MHDVSVIVYRERTMEVKTRALRTFGLSAAAAIFLLVAACSEGGSGDDQLGSAPDEGSGSSGLTIIQPGRPGEDASTGSPEEPVAEQPSHADIAFMQMMVPHHAQAVEMAGLARR